MIFLVVTVISSYLVQYVNLKNKSNLRCQNDFSIPQLQVEENLEI